MTRGIDRHILEFERDNVHRIREGIEGGNVVIAGIGFAGGDLCGSMICLLALALPASSQEGYRVLADELVVNTQADWEAWASPTGVRVVGADGTVEPRFLRRDNNAVLDASHFRYVSEGDTLVGGILAAGSNRVQADLVIDGDDGSWWEPAPDTPVDGWWIDIDLGRVVVSRLVVRFAESGDPFLKFRVLISDGRTTFTTSSMSNPGCRCSPG